MPDCLSHRVVDSVGTAAGFRWKGCRLCLEPVRVRCGIYSELVAGLKSSIVILISLYSVHKAMKFTQLLYVSKAYRQMTDDELLELLSKARQFNASQQITGLLGVIEGYFVQCLEGERSKVNHLYNHITTDSRHHSVELLLYHSVDKRLFPNWSMGLLSEEQLKLHILGAKYKNFSPADLTDKYCVSLLYALAEYHELEHFTPL